MSAYIIHKKKPHTIPTRPCKIDQERKGTFHCWSQESRIVPPSIMKGGHEGGVIAGVLAIVELEDGAVICVSPERVTFTDLPKSRNT